MTRKKQPKKIGRCLDCGQVKTIFCKGLCANCYSKKDYAQTHSYLGTRVLCACGCGQSFIQTRKNRKFINQKHKHKVASKLWNKKHRRHYRYLARVYCPKCGELGNAFAVYMDFQGYTKMISFCIQHTKGVYSHQKYLAKKLKYGIRKGRSPRGRKEITKWLRCCYIF